MNELHHSHIFASNIDATIRWWKTMLNANVAFDGALAGARNVFLRVGNGRLHIYDQKPWREERQGAIHHLGIKTDDLQALVAHMRSQGVAFRSDIREFGNWRYIMVAAPDDVLLELFQFDIDTSDPALASYFSSLPRAPAGLLAIKRKNLVVDVILGAGLQCRSGIGLFFALIQSKRGLRPECKEVVVAFILAG